MKLVIVPASPGYAVPPDRDHTVRDLDSKDRSPLYGGSLAECWTFVRLVRAGGSDPPPRPKVGS